MAEILSKLARHVGGVIAVVMIVVGVWMVIVGIVGSTESPRPRFDTDSAASASANALEAMRVEIQGEIQRGISLVGGFGLLCLGAILATDRRSLTPPIPHQ